MLSSTLFYVFIGILTLSFLVNKMIERLNAKHFDDEIPKELKDVYQEDDYKKSQAYKKTNYRFRNISSLVSFSGTLIFFFLDGFEFVDNFARSLSNNAIVVALIFFGIILIASTILTLPFSYYNTFVIEERFGFNKATKKLFLLDKMKEFIITAVLGGGILSLIIWFINLQGKISGSMLGDW